MSSDNQLNLRVSANAQDAADQCAEHILNSLAVGLKTEPRVTLAISGGSTPKLLFQTMAKTPFDWENVHIFWVDERCVPPNDKQSNFKLADQALLSPVHLSKHNVHRIQGELPPEEGAARYVDEIREFFSLKNGELPSFDVIHRGMGPDAHTASLFPGDPLIGDREGIAASVYSKSAGNFRVTLLPGVLLAAKQNVILAAGDDKAVPLKNVLQGPDDPFQYPCQLAARGAANAFWFVDKAAAAQL